MSNPCLVCGNPVKRKGAKFCSRVCYAEYRQHKRTCVVCGILFPVPKSSDKICCSPQCSKKHRQQLQAAGVYKKANKKWQSERKIYEQTHMGDKHPNAKFWRLQSPEGHVYEVTNLKDFIRQNIGLFDGSTVKQAYDGIVKLKASKLGKRKKPSYTYKGWQLVNYCD